MILLFVLAALIAADGVLTYRALRSGKGKEGNPVARWLMARLGLVLGIALPKLMLFLFIVWLTVRFDQPLVPVIPILIYGYVCWNNWRVLTGRG